MTTLSWNRRSVFDTIFPFTSGKLKRKGSFGFLRCVVLGISGLRKSGRLYSLQAHRPKVFGRILETVKSHVKRSIFLRDDLENRSACTIEMIEHKSPVLITSSQRPRVAVYLEN